jgi:drug/metabolite transporter (DMT)-like permease
MTNFFPWIMVVSTVILTGYGQLVLKWQVNLAAPAPFSFANNWPPLIVLLLRPWVISAFVAAFGASLCWMLALQRLQLSKAYPFMALNFVVVSLMAVPLFGEIMTPTKIAGLLIIVFGLIVLSQG